MVCLQSIFYSAVAFNRTSIENSFSVIDLTSTFNFYIIQKIRKLDAGTSNILKKNSLYRKLLNKKRVNLPLLLTLNEN